MREPDDTSIIRLFFAPLMITQPNKFKQIAKCVKFKASINYLDVGCGSHSPTITKKRFPNCSYTGVDIDPYYNNTEEDIAAIDHLVQTDLTKLDLDELPENHYDVIVMSHVIEHLENGDKVIEVLLTKLKSGGVIYIEFPSPHSVDLPSKKETLNFYDDPTHVRIYSIGEVSELLQKSGLSVIASGLVRDWFKIALMPIKIPLQKIQLGYVKGGVYWDWYGFASFVTGVKP